MKNKVVILSGGLDSTTMLYSVADEFGSDNVHAISFNYGQKQIIELSKASISCQRLSVKHTIVDMRFLGDMVSGVSALINTSDIPVPSIEDVLGDPAPVTEVPYRNMIMCSLSFAYAQANNCDSVYIGIQRHDQYGYWDTSESFMEVMNAASSLNRKHSIRLEAPFVDLSKAEEIELGIKLNVPYIDTWTCYEGPNEHDESCGICPTCSERVTAFAKVGLKDPIPYAIMIPWSQMIDKFNDDSEV